MSQLSASGTEGIDVRATVKGVRDDIVTIQLLIDEQGDFYPIIKNELVHICPQRRADDERQEYLKAEVLRVRLGEADVQVFESTRGVAVGDPVEQTGDMLSVLLGPGLLGQVYDGLQNPLEVIASGHGYFLPRGLDVSGIDTSKKWAFQPRVSVGARVSGGDCLGVVQEGRFTHQIMVPFQLSGEAEVSWIQEGSFTVTTVVARLRSVSHRRNANSLQTDGLSAQDDVIEVSMMQRWPVRIPLSTPMLKSGRSQRCYPNVPLLTSIRLVDTFFPVAKGGTACIPGPFGAGKTVLQGLIARFSDVDIVIIVACGERAGEVVETITEFPNMPDPKGGTLMDRTIIICNTSSMPVAAREASIYTGLTLAEYYRQMGYNALLIADSTSRWAQAMRETSGRLEEIPGEEAFPAYLDSSVRALYERAGVIQNNAGQQGTLTMIGTVSPAGGNFEEPVTQSTLRAVKTFLGLSADRAYKRAYPAIDPLLSWSRYTDQVSGWYTSTLGDDWLLRVSEAQQWLRDAQAIEQMMQVTGEEGVTLEDYCTFLKAKFLDEVFLQQDAFDTVDASTPMSRQNEQLRLIQRVMDGLPAFDDKAAAQHYFMRITGLFKNLNYSAETSPDYATFKAQLFSK
ncbi:V-type ATP synthase subunit A [Neptunomonas phycophila]|uniref:V-type ATP synthase alpha chain n=1 Tax=Neptunomonas phycophila TaxID=1572645 RepID=A0AAW7XII9_9GAMM|nr:V-type ATP synthase subunit A [Neptunomonas phycophila]MDO6453830.1 V-type ATP synthase subunit A [Neptunomonas phycophila]